MVREIQQTVEMFQFCSCDAGVMELATAHNPISSGPVSGIGPGIVGDRDRYDQGSPDIHTRYEIHEWRNAFAILSAAHSKSKGP